MTQQINKPIRFTAENDNCDTPTGKILFILDALVHGQKNVETNLLRDGEQLAVRLPRKARPLARFGIRGRQGWSGTVEGCTRRVRPSSKLLYKQ
jgi:hypothetical protein